MEDTIYRQAAIDVLKGIDRSDGVGLSSLKCEAVDDALAAIKALPSAQQWIKLTPKTMPKKIGDYLVTTYSGQLARYIYMDNDTSKEYWIRTVIAWMPLPEPYKEKKMEKKLLTEIVTSVLTDRLCDGCKDTHSPYSYESCKGGSCDLCRSKAAEEVVAIINAQPETCVGCKHYGKWDNEVEYGYNSPCTNCRRRTADNYEQ